MILQVPVHAGEEGGATQARGASALYIAPPLAAFSQIPNTPQHLQPL